MLRMLATRKWVGLTVLAIVVIVAFGALSYWQWQRAQRDQVAQQAPVPASTVLDGDEPLAATDYGRRVTATGTYDAAQQLLVDHGGSTYWVLTPLVPADGGPALPVVRGTASSRDDPAVAAVPTGSVSVVGTAQPFEGDPGGMAAPQDGVVPLLTSAALPYTHAGGWIALESQDPPSSPALAPAVAPFGGEGTKGLRLQNAGYAVQWVLFAVFVVFLWARMLREDLRDARAQAPAREQAAAPEVY